MFVTPNKFNIKPTIVIPNVAPRDINDEQWIVENCSACINVSDSEYSTFTLIRNFKFPSFWFPVHEIGQWGYAPFYGAAKVYDQFKNSGKPILIHCAACVNRSPTVAFAILSSTGLSITEINLHLNENMPMSLIQRNIDKGYIPHDIFDFLKARYDHPTYSLMGLLHVIKSPNSVYKKNK